MSELQSTMALNWLKEKVFPLWSHQGIDPQTGVFVESLSLEGVPQPLPRRALVQARQIFSFIEGYRLNVIDLETLRPILTRATRAFLNDYAIQSGAFVHSVDLEAKKVNADVDLYTQAFALFGLAHAYEILCDDSLKSAALKTLDYLYRERSHPAGGFTEIKNGELFFQSNPHMHLFEAAIAWVKIDPDPRWKKLAHELYQLCSVNFIDTETGFLAEHFDDQWQPVREKNNFIFEPGHHYEWAWLFIQYQKITSTQTGTQARKLFDLAERFGLDAEKKLAYDEIWSDRSVKKMSSRFWPQCERIKAAAELNESAIAATAMKSLFSQFIVPSQGLWRDTLLDSGRFDSQPAKASSLYHIIYAISEFVKHT